MQSIKLRKNQILLVLIQIQGLFERPKMHLLKKILEGLHQNPFRSDLMRKRFTNLRKLLISMNTINRIKVEPQALIQIKLKNVTIQIYKRTVSQLKTSV